MASQVGDEGRAQQGKARGADAGAVRRRLVRQAVHDVLRQDGGDRHQRGGQRGQRGRQRAGQRQIDDHLRKAGGNGQREQRPRRARSRCRRAAPPGVLASMRAMPACCSSWNQTGRRSPGMADDLLEHAARAGRRQWPAASAARGRPPAPPSPATCAPRRRRAWCPTRDSSDGRGGDARRHHERHEDEAEAADAAEGLDEALDSAARRPRPAGRTASGGASTIGTPCARSRRA